MKVPLGVDQWGVDGPEVRGGRPPELALPELGFQQAPVPPAALAV